MQAVLAFVFALLAVPGVSWDAMARAQSIESAPLAPPESRLPGGIVVPPSNEMPDGAEIPIPATPEAAPLSGEDEETVAIPYPGEEGVPPPEGVLPDAGEIPRDDLFKRAPPGIGDSGPQRPDPIEPVARIDAPGAVFRQLDKLTGRIDTFELAAGGEITVDRLRVALGACRLPEDGSTGNNIAFLRIWDTKHPEEPPVFSGWMFADSPALSAMDHPRYDLWLIQCKTSAGTASSESR